MVAAAGVSQRLHRLRDQLAAGPSPPVENDARFSNASNADPPMHGRGGSQIVTYTDKERAAALFREQGFVLVGEALPADQLSRLRDATGRIFSEVASYDTESLGSRGSNRYGLGAMTDLPEWSQLIDNPRIAPILDAIWGHVDYQLLRCGMNGSFPGAADQGLHMDIAASTFDAPGSTLRIQEMPLFSVTVHYPCVDMESVNGTIRIVPKSNRWVDQPIPNLEEEPVDMRASSELHCLAGTAIINDIRYTCRCSLACLLRPSPTHLVAVSGSFIHGASSYRLRVLTHCVLVDVGTADARMMPRPRRIRRLALGRRMLDPCPTLSSTRRGSSAPMTITATSHTHVSRHCRRGASTLRALWYCHRTPRQFPHSRMALPRFFVLVILPWARRSVTRVGQSRLSIARSA